MPADLSRLPSLRALVATNPAFHRAWMEGRFPPGMPTDGPADIPAPPEREPPRRAVRERDEPREARPRAPRGTGGPGTELHAIFASLGVRLTSGCGCQSRISQMDVWGVATCRERKEEIVAWLREGQKRFGWRDKLTAAAKMVTTGLLLKVDWTDPFPGIVEEAIRRAAAKTPRDRYPEIITRHLIYHVYAPRANDVWRKNLVQLRRRRGLFNGRCVFAAAMGLETHGMDEILREADWPDAQWIVMPNDPTLCERTTFPSLLETIRTGDPTAAFFYAHTKGTANKAGDATGIMYWRNAMYHNLLDRWDDVATALRRYSAVGTNKLRWRGQKGFPNNFNPQKRWMFAGTFFWMRCDRVFSDPKALTVADNRFAVEGWPATFLDADESVSLFQPWSWKSEFKWGNSYDPAIYMDPIADD